MDRYMYVIVAADSSQHYGFSWSQETAIAEADRLQEKLLKKMNVFEIDTRSQEIELVPEQGEYWYGMMHRPFAPGAQPMEGFWYRLPAYERNAVDPGHCFYDILVYHNELDAKAVRDYELVRILG